MAHSPRAGTPERGEEILDVALKLFRKKGFERATMRDIAEAAGLSLGAAYYYFPSKDALILAYYERLNVEHLAATRAAFAATTDVRARLGVTIHGKLEQLQKDRKLLGALFRFVGEPDSPLSPFSARTRAIRNDAVTLLDEALSTEPWPEDLRPVLASALWMLMLGSLLYMLHDASPKQAKTHALVDGSLDVTLNLARAASMPMMQPAREKLHEMLVAADLVK
jgi:AcrR family transcriptional regulator